MVAYNKYVVCKKRCPNSNLNFNPNPNPNLLLHPPTHEHIRQPYLAVGRTLGIAHGTAEATISKRVRVRVSAMVRVWVKGHEGEDKTKQNSKDKAQEWTNRKKEEYTHNYLLLLLVGSLI